MASEYGIDAKWADDDLTAGYELQTEEIIVLEALARRLQSKPGSLFYDDDYGYDISCLINLPYSGNISSRIENECLKDERVKFAKCNVYEDKVNESLTIVINITLMQNSTFNLIFDLRQTDIDVAYQRLS